MPTKRRVARPMKQALTPRAVELWRELRELEPTWRESTGAERVRYLDLFHALNRELGIKPWDVPPGDVDGPDSPLRRDHSYAESWARSWAIRQALDAAVEESHHAG